VIPTPRITGPLDAGGQELARLLANLPLLTFHAAYRSRAIGVIAAGKGDVGLELWSAPPRFRRDSSITRGSDFVRTTEIFNGTARFNCAKSGPSEPWRCANGTDTSDISGGSIFDVILEAIQGRRVTPRDATISGRFARCFRIAPPAASPAAIEQDVCVTLQGIPLLVDSGNLIIEATTIDSVIPDSVFTPPATVR
jgi:hypothetical protein